jgi:hypothetical protein
MRLHRSYKCVDTIVTHFGRQMSLHLTDLTLSLSLDFGANFVFFLYIKEAMRTNFVLRFLKIL